MRGDVSHINNLSTQAISTPHAPPHRRNARPDAKPDPSHVMRQNLAPKPAPPPQSEAQHAEALLRQQLHN